MTIAIPREALSCGRVESLPPGCAPLLGLRQHEPEPPDCAILTHLQFGSMAMKRLFAVLSAAVVFLAIACSTVMAKLDAENLAVPHFHAQYNAARYDQIYNEAAKGFRSASKKEEYDQFMAAVRRKLGAVKTTESQSWNVNVTPAGAQISLSYKTQFENGSRSEEHTSELPSHSFI